MEDPVKVLELSGKSRAKGNRAHFQIHRIELWTHQVDREVYLDSIQGRRHSPGSRLVLTTEDYAALRQFLIDNPNP